MAVLDLSRDTMSAIASLANDIVSRRVISAEVLGREAGRIAEDAHVVVTEVLDLVHRHIVQRMHSTAASLDTDAWRTLVSRTRSN